MAATTDQSYAVGIHPLHAALLAGAVPLFVGGLLSDLAYRSSFEIQWSNFAAWLIAGAMIFIGFALLWGMIDLVRSGSRDRRKAVYLLLLVAVFVVGLLNCFVHARDAWAVMPAGLILSLIACVLVLIALWLGFWGIRGGAAQ